MHRVFVVVPTWFESEVEGEFAADEFYAKDGTSIVFESLRATQLLHNRFLGFANRFSSTDGDAMPK